MEIIKIINQFKKLKNYVSIFENIKGVLPTLEDSKRNLKTDYPVF